MIFFVYILKSLKDGNLYIGQTNDLMDRLSRHNGGQVVSTRNRRPLSLIYKEVYSNRTEAIKREKHLKSLKNSKYILDNVVAKR